MSISTDEGIRLFLAPHLTPASELDRLIKEQKNKHIPLKELKYSDIPQVVEALEKNKGNYILDWLFCANCLDFLLEQYDFSHPNFVPIARYCIKLHNHGILRERVLSGFYIPKTQVDEMIKEIKYAPSVLTFPACLSFLRPKVLFWFAVIILIFTYIISIAEAGPYSFNRANVSEILLCGYSIFSGLMLIYILISPVKRKSTCLKRMATVVSIFILPIMVQNNWKEECAVSLLSPVVGYVAVWFIYFLLKYIISQSQNKILKGIKE